MSENETPREEWKAKNEPRLRKQAADQAPHNDETASRKVSDWLNLWPVCTHPRCRRGRRCNGDFGSDGLFCFREISGETKLFIDKACEVVAQGRSFDEAKLIAGTAVLDLRGGREIDELMKEVVAYGREVLERVRKRMRAPDKEDEEDEINSTGYGRVI